MDNDMVQCPFVKSHRVLSHRLPMHIVKCKASYCGPEMEKCMYNACHYVPKGTLEEHYEKCRSFYEFHRELNEHFYKKQNIDDNVSEYTEDDKSFYSF